MRDVKMSATAPIVATIIEPITPPPKDTPKKWNKQPPSTEPSIPMIMLPMIPNPLLFISFPLNHPAVSPTKINNMNSIIFISQSSVNKYRKDFSVLFVSIEVYELLLTNIIYLIGLNS